MSKPIPTTSAPYERTIATKQSWCRSQGLTPQSATPTEDDQCTYERYTQAVPGRPDLQRVVILRQWRNGHWEIYLSPDMNHLEKRPVRTVQYDMFALIN